MDWEVTDWKIDPLDRNNYHLRRKLMVGMDDDYYKISYIRMKREVSIHIYEILEQMTNPCVVAITENFPDPKDSIDLYFEAEICVRFTPVQHNDVVFYNSPVLSVQTFLRDYTPKPEKFIDKLKYLFGKSK